jgi:hypothetical protein
MKPLFLHEDELTAVMIAAAALEIRNRGPFLQVVATALREHGEQALGPGLVYRTISSVQRLYRDPPDLTGAVAKYGAFAAPWPEGKIR